MEYPLFGTPITTSNDFPYKHVHTPIEFRSHYFFAHCDCFVGRQYAIAGRVLVGSISPITLSFVRWGLAALLLLPLG